MQGGSRKPLFLTALLAAAALVATASVENAAAAGTSTTPASSVPGAQVKCTCYPCGINCPQIPLPPPPPPPSEYWPLPYAPPPPPPSEYWPMPYGQPPPSNPYLYITGKPPGNGVYPFDTSYLPSGAAAAARQRWAAGGVPVFVFAGVLAVMKLWWL